MFARMKGDVKGGDRVLKFPSVMPAGKQVPR
jgi:hypothetical protein